jgi:hypothetical protein
MTNQFRIEHNLETGEVIEIELTAEEIAELSALRAETETRIAAESQKATDKAALLAKLGITEDEVQLLLGGN